MDEDFEGAAPEDVSAVTTEAPDDPAASPADRKLVERIIRRIKDDKAHHRAAFDRMRRDMHVATWGAKKDWPEGNYRANLAGRVVQRKTAALYAKNPRMTARRKQKLDFRVWDGNQASLLLATQTIQAAQVAATAPLQMDPATGQTQAPDLPPGFEVAQATLEDFQQGMAARQMYAKLGKTLEIAFEHFMHEQQPLDFKRGMKQVVRRAATCCVGYVELDFQREYGVRPDVDAKLADARGRLDHLQKLIGDAQGEDSAEDDPEVAELQHMLAALEAEPDVVVREGLTFDFPMATRVIPDRLCKYLEGFVGAGHVSVEYTYTLDQMEEKFQVDRENFPYTPYTSKAGGDMVSANTVMDDDTLEWAPMTDDRKKNGLVRVWKHYDKTSGLVYWLADGHQDFLMPPAPPNVFVEGFWPLYPLTFNAVENEDELFPPSDVSLMMDMQTEHNRSRHGMREHRMAARPRWVAAQGVFGSEEDTVVLRDLAAFELALLNIDPGVDIRNVLQQVPVSGVDPNLYQTEQFMTDIQLTVGAQESQFGGTSNATATESAIAAGSTQATDTSSIDDLDSFLTVVARAGSQILLREMGAEQIVGIVGVGAVWPGDASMPIMSAQDLVGEVWLEVQAGSTGKPNQAVEIRNWQQLLPFLIQMGSIDPMWLVKETLRRLDDNMDLTDAVAAGIPSIVSQNQGGGGAAQNVAAAGTKGDPAAQGPSGSNNAPQPAQEGGSGPAFGSNQV